MLVALIPFGYAFLFGYCSIPPDKSTYNVSAIQTESVASILDLDLTSVHSFPGFITTDKVEYLIIYIAIYNSSTPRSKFLLKKVKKKIKNSPIKHEKANHELPA